MNIQSENFVVAIAEGGIVKRYFAIDPSTGYPYFPENLSSAKFFTTNREAADVAVGLGEKSNTPQKPHSGGTLYPHTDIHNALKICNTKMKAQGLAVVLKINQDPTESVPIHGEIKEPTGYIYD